MELRQRITDVYLPRLVSFGVTLAIGVLAFIVASHFGDPTKKKIAIGLAVAVLPIVLFYTRRPRMIFLFGWVFTLTYNRAYFIFDAVLGNNGSQGIYVVPADVFLFALYALWAYELIVAKRIARPHGSRLWPWAVPFAVACVLSTLASDKFQWGVSELFRFVKVALIVLYVRFNFRRDEWFTCLAAIACAVMAQSALGILQVVRKTQGGVFATLGVGGAGKSELAALGSAALGGWVRAQGTMLHPSNLACYLLLVNPPLLALAFTARSTRIRVASAIAGLIGLAGLACTLSRWPWVLCACQLIGLGAFLSALKLQSARRILGIACVAGFACVIALIPMKDKIYERITGDLSESLDFRARQNETVLAMATKHPLLGVGLNNYKEHLLDYEPEMRWTLENEDEARIGLSIRVFVAPHNLYMFVLAETGALGLVGLFAIMVGSLVIGTRAVVRCRGPWQGASIGLTLGLIALYLQQLVDFSLWVDSVLYTAALAVGMLAVAPALSAASQRPGTLENNTVRSENG